jgi:stage II sporulation protein GA (sporulation sigma-E factor processing peptidase)
MEVYVDVVFEINFFMDMLIFYIAAKIMNRSVKLRRIVFGALVSAFLYCILMFTPFQKYMNVFGALSVLLISVKVVFSPKKISDMLFSAFVVTISSFVVGGTALGIFYYFNLGKADGTSFGINTDNIPVKVLCFAASVVFVLIYFGNKILKSSLLKSRCICTLTIENNGKRALLKGFMDTGNSLYEPISGKPVVVAELKYISKLLPDKLTEFFSNGINSPPEAVYESLQNEIFVKKIRLIPFKSIGRENGIMIGFEADSILIDGTRIDKPIIGISYISFSKNGSYNAIVNPEMVC